MNSDARNDEGQPVSPERIAARFARDVAYKMHKSKLAAYLGAYAAAESACVRRSEQTALEPHAEASHQLITATLDLEFAWEQLVTPHRALRDAIAVELGRNARPGQWSGGAK